MLKSRRIIPVFAALTLACFGSPALAHGGGGGHGGGFGGGGGFHGGGLGGSHFATPSIGSYSTRTFTTPTTSRMTGAYAGHFNGRHTHFRRGFGYGYPYGFYGDYFDDYGYLYDGYPGPNVCYYSPRYGRRICSSY